MTGCTDWVYRPYKPFLRDMGDIHVCRVAPSINSIHIEWLDIFSESYKVYCGIRGEALPCVGVTNATQFDITGLEADRDYEFYISSDNKRSLVRPVVRFLHSIGVDYMDFVRKNNAKE